MSTADFIESMALLGLDIPQDSDAFVLSDAFPVYCPNGRFSCPDMLEVVGTFYNESLDLGFVGARGTGEMSWALRDSGQIARIDRMEYEARLNQVLAQFPYTACCQYDARRFDGATLMDVLQVHPVMIVHGQLVQNPFYVEPDQFLKEMVSRNSNS